MKKTLITAIMALAFTGVATATTEQPVAATAPAWQKHFTFEGIHNIATEDDFDIDTTGFRLTTSLYSDGGQRHHHQLSFGIAPAWGSEDDLDVTHMPVTLGYHFNYDVTDDLTLFVGSRLGYAYIKLETDGWEDDATGFTYAIGFGAKYKCTERLYIQAAYEYGCSTFDVEDSDEDLDYGANTFSFGIGLSF